MARKSILDKVITKIFEVKVVQLHENLEQENTKQRKKRKYDSKHKVHKARRIIVYSRKGIKPIFFWTIGKKLSLKMSRLCRAT